MIPKDLNTFRSEVREYAQSRVRERAAHQDATESFDAEVALELAQKGWLGISAPTKLGGGGKPATWVYAAVEELAAEEIAAASVLTGQFTLVSDLLARESPPLAKRWVPQILQGIANGCYALTEPDAGSNPAQLSTQVEQRGDSLVVTGQKMWITNGNIADFAIVYGKETEQIGAYLVPLDDSTVTRQPIHGKMGFRASDTAELSFLGTVIPIENRIGELGQGLHVALRTLDNGRVGIAALATGALSGIKARLAKAAKESGSQRAMATLADTETGLAVSRALLGSALARKEAGERFTKEAAMAKWRATASAVAAANALMETESPTSPYTERMFRDVRVMELFEGTSEIQKLIIGFAATGVKAFT